MDRVRVYRNLRTGTLSLQKKVNGRWKVTDHPYAVELMDVKFVVHKAGHARVLKEKRKNVHAFVEGLLCDQFPTAQRWAMWHGMLSPSVKYKPYKHDYFYRVSNGKQITNCLSAFVSPKGIWI